MFTEGVKGDRYIRQRFGQFHQRFIELATADAVNGFVVNVVGKVTFVALEVVDLTPVCRDHNLADLFLYSRVGQCRPTPMADDKVDGSSRAIAGLAWVRSFFKNLNL